MEQIAPPSQLKYIFRFIDDLGVDDTRRLTSALSTHRIWPATIDNTEHLPVFLARLCERWLPIIRGAMAERNADILIRRFSLDGHKHALLRELSEEYGVSKDRIRILERVSLGYLRKGGHDKDLLQIALDVAAFVALPINPLDNASKSMASYE
jgi:hypothetical protein